MNKKISHSGIEAPAFEQPLWTITRRRFLKLAGMVVAGMAWRPLFAALPGEKPLLRFGMITDIHYAGTESKNDRFYRESLAKLEECTTLMNDEKVEFLIELGDFKDQGEPPSEAGTLRYLETIEKALSGFKGPRYHVLGNHDMDSISKDQFLSRIKNTGIHEPGSFYSFDSGGCHLVVLDANYRADGPGYDHGNYDWKDANIPPAETEWLRGDLLGNKKPVVVFVHQRLDGDGDTTIRNAAEIRGILEENRNILAVFQGHDHAGGYSCIGNIHYYTLKAMVTGSGAENSSYAVVEIMRDHSLRVTGYRRAVSMDLKIPSTVFSF